MHTAHPENSADLSSQLPLLLAHIPRYRRRGIAALARDAALPKATVNRLVRGIGSPSYITVLRVTDALCRATRREVNPRDLLDHPGEFLRSACAAVGCAGCVPNARSAATRGQ